MYNTAAKVRKRRDHTTSKGGRVVDCDLHYSIMETPFGRDVTGELVHACRNHGLGVGLYYSHIDWFDCDFRLDHWNYQYDPGYNRQSDPEGFSRFLARYEQQLVEICTQYGKLDILSLDMGFPGFADDLEYRDYFRDHAHGAACGIRPDIVRIIKKIRRLQPDMLIRRRGIDPYGDYMSPERCVPTSEEAANATPLPWKVIYPGSNNFSFNYSDVYKPASWVIENLIDISAKGGVFQVGYGPAPNGTWPLQMQHRLKTVGEWLAVNGEGVYRTRALPVYGFGRKIRYTRSKDGQWLYAFVMQPDEACHAVVLPGIEAAENAPVHMLGMDQPLKWQQDGRNVKLFMPDSFCERKNWPCEIAHCYRIKRPK